jgi:hypothetical protein
VKIDGLSNFLSSTLQTVSELNLKEGQIIMGKVISLAVDEAVLEIAGRMIEAKVEGNPPAVSGQVASFQVSKDEMGRILLKFMTNGNDAMGTNNTQSTSGTNPTYHTSNNGSTSGVVSQSTPSSQNLQPTMDKAPDPGVLKNIQTALRKEGLQPTPENIDKIWRGMQEFQVKYQQPVSPQVFAFIAAKKWPVTPGTILASMVFQDKDTRDLLWNLLRKSLPEKEFNAFINKFALLPQAGPEILAGKMAAFRDVKNLQDLFGKLFQLAASAENPPENQEPPNTPSKIDPKNILANTPQKAPQEAATPGSRSTADMVRPEARQGSLVNNKEEVINTASKQTNNPQEMLNKAAGVIESKTLGMTGKLGRAEQQKIAAVLEQHINISKSVPSNEPTGPNYSIPFLINEPKTGLREFVVKWREESHKKNEQAGQLLFITIPTANMGDINLSLRVTGIGTGINMKVDSQEVREYLLTHMAELKAAIGGTDGAVSREPSIVVSLKESENITGKNMGFDLWM